MKMLQFSFSSVAIVINVLLVPIVLTSIEPNVDYGDPRLDEMLNFCIDSQNHKSRPGPEDKLHQQCTPWAKRGCCTPETTMDLHYSKMYNFDRNHCSHLKKMSDACDRHFRQDLCFYECSPNVGPWVVKVNNTFRKQRFYKAPLCMSDCESWFNDCASDLTCTDNWPQNMDFIKGLGNKCPKGSVCKTFKEIYQTAEYFCSVVWDHSWEVVPDHQPCMHLWFDPETGNPNDAVAKWKATRILKGLRCSSSDAGETSKYLNVLILITLMMIKSFYKLF